VVSRSDLLVLEVGFGHYPGQDTDYSHYPEYDTDYEAREDLHESLSGTRIFYVAAISIWLPLCASLLLRAVAERRRHLVAQAMPAREEICESEEVRWGKMIRGLKVGWRDGHRGRKEQRHHIRGKRAQARDNSSR